MNHRPSNEERFRKNMETLCNRIKRYISVANANGIETISDMKANLATTLTLSFKTHQLIERFVIYSHQYWDKILVKDESFFRQNAMQIFLQDDSIDEESVVKFDKIIDANINGKPIISPSEKEDMWKIFLGFIKISIHYIEDNHLVKNGSFTAQGVSIPFDLKAMRDKFLK